MDGWGSLTMLIKRQNADKYRKAELRYKLQKRKEKHVHDAYDRKGESLDFPEVSSSEMVKIKEDIRKKIKTQKIRNLLSYAIAILLIGAFIFFAFASSWFIKSTV